MGAVKELEMEIRECRIVSSDLADEKKVMMESARTLLRLKDLLDGIVAEKGYAGLCRYSRRAKALHLRTGQLALALGAMAVRRPKESKVTVVARNPPKWKRTFETRDECFAWLNDGLAGTEGAEQEHYAKMLVELNGGATTLHYN